MLSQAGCCIVSVVPLIEATGEKRSVKKPVASTSSRSGCWIAPMKARSGLVISMPVAVKFTSEWLISSHGRSARVSLTQT
ncbi:hypothetical protein D3C87_2010850 [compost metagenome]